MFSRTTVAGAARQVLVQAVFLSSTLLFSLRSSTQKEPTSAHGAQSFKMFQTITFTIHGTCPKPFRSLSKFRLADLNNLRRSTYSSIQRRYPAKSTPLQKQARRSRESLQASHRRRRSMPFSWRIKRLLARKNLNLPQLLHPSENQPRTMTYHLQFTLFDLKNNHL